MGILIRIFLVDGYAVMRDALRALIATAPDMEVVGDAADGSEAIKKALHLNPDVIILDIATLENDSMTVVSSLKKLLSRPRILILTNEINKQEILTAIDAGVEGYLIKGTAAPEILQVIRGLYRGESRFDPAVTNALL